MSNLEKLLETLLKMPDLTQKEMDDTLALLNLYTPLVKQSIDCINECTEVCFETRRQSVTDFINLALDHDRDSDCKRIAEILRRTGHYMDLLQILEAALLRLRDDPFQKKIYYQIINARYFDCNCQSNESAFLQLGIASSTFYRNIRPAQQAYGVKLWHVVVPNLIIAARTKN